MIEKLSDLQFDQALIRTVDGYWLVRVQSMRVDHSQGLLEIQSYGSHLRDYQRVGPPVVEFTGMLLEAGTLPGPPSKPDKPVLKPIEEGRDDLMVIMDD